VSRLSDFGLAVAESGAQKASVPDVTAALPWKQSWTDIRQHTTRSGVPVRNGSEVPGERSETGACVPFPRGARGVGCWRPSTAAPSDLVRPARSRSSWVPPGPTRGVEIIMQQGQGLVEYALILVLVSVVVIVVLALLGPAIGNVFSNIVFGI